MPTHREMSFGETTRRESAGPVLVALLVPFAGFWLGVKYLLRERVGKGLAMIVLAFVCFWIWAFVLSAAFAVGVERSLNESAARTRTRTCLSEYPPGRLRETCLRATDGP